MYQDCICHCKSGNDPELDYFRKQECSSKHRDSLTTLYNVDHQPCMLFYCMIVKGYNITKGSALQNWMDTPDPYVKGTIRTSPHGEQRTPTIDNEVNPVWNHMFKFYLDPQIDNELVLELMDANYTIDEHLCTVKIKLKDIALSEKRIYRRLQFNDTSEVDIEMWAEHDDSPRLRYSLTLCEEEKQFVDDRRRCVFKAMKEILGDAAPANENEVPTIGVLGSGGGFRAMTAFSGVMSALVDTKISDMVMYNVGLSGSAWYLSTLYSHPDWPEKSPKELRKELRDSINSNWVWKLFDPSSMYRYLKVVAIKRQRGQPVSFTDLFGHLVGETLLKNRLDAKLSDQQTKIKGGRIPMPMYSCLHVKKHVSAMVFHEWMEFSPYEIGMPKYGTFMRPELFGSKFFIGHLVKEFDEPPLHFLQGIWGSAFCIQLNRLFKDDKKVGELEALEQERDELERELTEEMSSQDDESSDTSDSESDGDKENSTKKPKSFERKGSNASTTSNGSKKRGFFTSMFGSILEKYPLLKTIDGRAATVHNFMRGLSLYKAYPFSPFTSLDGKRKDDDKLNASSYFSARLKAMSPKKKTPGTIEETFEGQDQFDGIFEMYPTSIKKLYVVDGGLSFNSPYPLLLRPQRGVDIILSFDFSARKSDTTPPFKELLLAAEWASLNNVPFPKIDPSVVDREGLKECYVFENKHDPRCPIVMHFVLVNITFRDYIKPGVRRRTAEEREYADFDIFDDPNKPYSTFNFKYSNKAFDRLSDLTEFNTCLCKDLILEKIKECVKRVHQYHTVKQRPIMLKDIKKLRLQRSKEKQLELFVKSFDQDDGDFPLT
ncbi:cytosolic phospholipase A2-like isoform X1 [Mya arenaria]|uniref:cytosolic phospholipase A2-like isoform X1 n=1 Tax=Mya arenaria TaxID=6604 RepID=UPI0022E09FA6|nr:cytosolic phospholipase A2-like isoform X1 [Mya arenaria]